MLSGQKIYCLAYTDDMLLVGSSPTDVQLMLNFTTEFLEKRGMMLCSTKCKINMP